jgi:thiol-disulfide isomerase/thioredoxin/predicted negative regulator of RcsB-dependent stress response
VLKAINAMWLRIVLRFVLIFSLLGPFGALPLCAAQSAAKPAQMDPAKQASTDADEQSALDNAFRSAQNNPQILIKNLEAFLARFPKSSRRELVLRTICTYALQANAPGVIVQYGQMLLEMTPDDPQLLSLLIEALARQNDPASRARAINYCSRLITIAEGQRDRAAATGVSNNTPARWAERIAAIYAQRAGFYRDSGDLDKAIADDEKSYATYPTARVAELLGDAALKKGDSARALDYYLSAFVFPDKTPDPARHQEVRRKLGSLYVAQHHSEKGLGDLVLARYDALMPQIAERYSGDQPQNAGRHDPFEYVLERMDGTSLPLASYRGKVIVMDFWATWCGPCRLQGKLVDQVAKNFRTDSSAAFLSLNVDQDRSGVPTFLKQEGWTLPVAYAQGLDQLLSVRELPTLVIFDRQGRIVYREDGVNPGSFAEELSKHLRETLQESAGSKQ